MMMGATKDRSISSLRSAENDSPQWPDKYATSQPVLEGNDVLDEHFPRKGRSNSKPWLVQSIDLTTPDARSGVRYLVTSRKRGGRIVCTREHGHAESRSSFRWPQTRPLTTWCNPCSADRTNSKIRTQWLPSQPGNCT